MDNADRIKECAVKLNCACGIFECMREDLEKERDQLRAENLQMRSALEAINQDAQYLRHVEKSYLAVGKEKYDFAKMNGPLSAIERKIVLGLEVKHTAHLARRLELLERVVDEYRDSCETDAYDNSKALKELDALEASKPERTTLE